jgi:16S rRNA (guanine966-N2)-methyltransferase
MRQAMFDMLMHAPWGGRALLDGAAVLDGFAGTGALGLEALSRGAATATFMDQDSAAIAAVRANVAACHAADRTRIITADLRRPPRGDGQRLVFLDPPYGQGLLPAAIAALRERGWIVPGTLIVSEIGRLEDAGDYGVKLAHKVHGAAQVNVWREV